MHPCMYKPYLVYEVGYDALHFVSIYVCLPKVLEGSFECFQVQLVGTLDQVAGGRTPR